MALDRGYLKLWPSPKKRISKRFNCGSIAPSPFNGSAALWALREKKSALLAWIIHEPRLPQMQGAAYEAVVPRPRMRCNTADAVRSARPSGEE
jgi:hypothetical protein